MKKASPSDEPSPTADLFGLARAGDKEALDRIVSRFGDRLLDRIRLLMGEDARRHAESGDFLNGTLLEVMKDLERTDVESESQFLRWATAIARNNIRDSLRKKREELVGRLSQTLSGDSSDQPDRQADTNEALFRLIEAIERLGSADRELIELRHFEELSFKEIGERTGRGEAVARVAHSRAMLRLGQALGR